MAEINNPLAGIHNDHETVAEAVRRVAYMINVPHAFTPEYPADETKSKPCKVPVIINLYDPYMYGENSFDLAVDVESAFSKKMRNDMVSSIPNHGMATLGGKARYVAAA